MKAIVWEDYGPPEVLKFSEVNKPKPNDHEVLIKIHATTVSAGDCEARRFDFPLWLWPLIRLFMGIRKPRIKILGQELSGVVEEIGKDVTRFEVGDEVFAATGFTFGTYAEYLCLHEHPADGVIITKPSNMSHEEATTIPVGGLNALHFMNLADIKEGQSVLINGAGGSIGTIAIQLAKYYDAEVTAVDNGPKLEMLRSLGADKTIDYTKQNFTRTGEKYDVIFDVVGKASYSRSIKSLNNNGTLLIGNPKFSHMFRSIFTRLISSKKVIIGTASYKPQELVLLKELIEEGHIQTVIDKTYTLEDIVEAHRYVESGDKQGNVVIKVVETIDDHLNE